MIFTGIAALLAFFASFKRWGRVPMVCWKPNYSTWVSISIAGFSIILSASLSLLSQDSLIRKILLYLVLYTCSGSFPFVIILWFERSSIESLGLDRMKSRKAWSQNCSISILFFIIILIRWSSFSEAIPSVFVLLKTLLVLFVKISVECSLFFAYLHRQLELSFGFLPATISTAFLYSLWQIGTEVPLELAAGGSFFYSLTKLFFVGILFQSLFCLSDCNVFSIWPFAMLSSSLLDFLTLKSAFIFTLLGNHILFSLGSMLILTVIIATVFWKVGLSSALHQL